MIHAEFYHLSTGYVQGSIPPRFEDSHKKPIPACGDRAVIILDGRNGLGTWHEIAARECEKRGYIGYRLMRGANMCRASHISEYIAINKG